MSVETKVTRRFPDNKVQVDIRSNNSVVRHFKLPEENIDKFCAQYKNDDKNIRRFSSVTFFGLSLLGALSGAMIPVLCKVKNKGIQCASSIGLCLLGSLISTKLVEHKITIKEAKLFKENDAEQVFY